MAQDWNLPAAIGEALSVIVTKFNDAAEALRTLHFGGSEPSSKVGSMLFHNGTTKYIEQRNESNSAWNRLLAANVMNGRFTYAIPVGALSASRTLLLGAMPLGWVIERVVLHSDTTTTGSSAGGTEWTFMLRDNTGGTPVDLFSATPSTATTVPGVGGGEITADQAYSLTPDQNQTLALNRVLELVITKVGSPTNLGDLTVIVDGRLAGAL